MKNPLQTVLIILSLGLCALCTWQWYTQEQVQRAMTAVSQSNYDQAMAIMDYTNQLRVADAKLSQMDAHMSELRDIISTNNVLIAEMRRDNNRLILEADQYSNAVVVLNAQMKAANESIRQQNDALKELVAQRDEFVQKLNESIKERNEVVLKYNELVKKFEEMQPKKK